MAHEASIREAFEDFIEDKLYQGARSATIHFYRSNVEHLFGAGERRGVDQEALPFVELAVAAPPRDDGGQGRVQPRRGSTELALQSFFAVDTSTHRIPLLPSWSAITVSEGALLSSTTVPPAARTAAIRCSATSGAT